LIVDLRGNPGGLLKQSIKVADLLLTHGHIVSTRGRHPDSLHHYEAGGRDLAEGIPIVVLVDGKSASASEIVAVALQDRGRAVVVGTSSFGKGTVQTVVRLPNDGEVTLTWSRFIAPSGYALHGLGVRPVVCTSGVANGSRAALDRFERNKPGIRAIYASWRRSLIDEKELRKALRQACASERRKSTVERRIAELILSKPHLYAQAIELTGRESQAWK
jgi:Periplasmic protease